MTGAHFPSASAIKPFNDRRRGRRYNASPSLAIEPTPSYILAQSPILPQSTLHTGHQPRNPLWPIPLKSASVADDTAWDAFVRQAIGGTVFSTSAWLRCAAAATGGQVHRLGCYRNDRLIAGISGLAHRRWGPLPARNPGTDALHRPAPRPGSRQGTSQRRSGPTPRLRTPDGPSHQALRPRLPSPRARHRR